jgi:hypothetical protein
LALPCTIGAPIIQGAGIGVKKTAVRAPRVFAAKPGDVLGWSQPTQLLVP